MSRTASSLAGGFALLLVGVALGWMGESAPWSGHGERTAESKKLGEAYQAIRSNYVDPVSAETLATRAIEGLAGSLDPHSAYIEPERMERVRETFEGSFVGIGVSYERIDGPRGQDTIFVATVVPGGPSAEAGVRPGDRILAVDGESVVGWSDERIRSRFTGPEGSTVHLKLRRPGRASPLRPAIERDDIPLRTLDAAYKLDDRTGYIGLRRFAQTTHSEFSQALAQLQDRGVERLILDLRGNAGGLMDQAVEIIDEFLVDDQLVVSARSEHNGYSEFRYTRGNGAFETGPLIVLVDSQSASASEIVAGALQDHDRALIVGSQTYGKGSVQRHFGFEDGSSLRLTVARFYTPSGRLLQRPHASPMSRPFGSSDGGGGTDSVTYRTDAGRLVRGGGGVRPDVVVNDEGSEKRYHARLHQRGLVRAFARSWIDRRVDSLRTRWEERPEAFVEEFSVPEFVLAALVDFAAGRGVPAPTRETASFGGSVGDVASSSGPALDASGRRALRNEIKRYLALRLFGTNMSVRVGNTQDPVMSRIRDAWPKAAVLDSKYPVF